MTAFFVAAIERSIESLIRQGLLLDGFDRVALGPQTNLDSLPLDSLARMNLLLTLDEQEGIYIPEDALAPEVTLADLAARIAGWSSTEERALSQSLAQFRNLPGRDILGRTDRFLSYIERRDERGVWPFARRLNAATGPSAVVTDRQGVTRRGLNFASQDYLGLSRHPSILAAAHDALDTFGPHSAGSAVLVGNTTITDRLEQALSELLKLPHVALFPTGWAAGYSAIAAFVRPQDYVVLDYLSHACLHQGAAAATRQVQLFNHNDPQSLEDRLRDIRRRDPDAGILVVTEGLFSMDSDTPDIRTLQRISHAYEARLLVDVAHDLGAMGPGGTGVLGQAGMIGEVDLVMGSFSKTFSSNGGFIASASEAVKQYACFYGNPHMFSNALSPVQAAVVTEALRIVGSPEGDELRARLSENICALRAAIEAAGFSCLGTPSPIVPATCPSDRIARLAAARAAEAGLFVNLVEFPAVPLGGARFRLQVMANHTPDDGREAGAILAKAITDASESLDAKPH